MVVADRGEVGWRLRVVGPAEAVGLKILKVWLLVCRLRRHRF